MSMAYCIHILLALVGQDPAAAPVDAEARLAVIKESVASYSFQPGDDPSSTVRLQAEPALKFENPISGIKEGGVYFWTDETGRPEVALSIFLLRSGLWWHEFTSLSADRFAIKARSGPDWSPTRPGVEFQPIPNAPLPADSAAQRLRQMRALAQEFTVDDDFQGKTWSTLRLLTKPLARYGKPGSALVDGALFSFSQGTNPEAFLLIEARSGPGGPRWQYAFAPMTAYELKASHKGKQVWALPWQKQGTPADPFYSRGYRP